MKPQKNHYGIEIKDQPKCKKCGGPMAISIQPYTLPPAEFWYCKSENEMNCDGTGNFHQIDLKPWLETAPPYIKLYFENMLKQYDADS